MFPCVNIIITYLSTVDVFSVRRLPVGTSIIDVTVLVQESHKFIPFLHLQFG